MMLRFILFLLGSAFIARGSARRLKPLNIGVILPFERSYPWTVDRALPALQMAMETITKNSILPGYRLHMMINDSRCSETDAPLAAFHLKAEFGARVFIGPVCDFAVAPVARFSPSWGIPIITVGGGVKAFDDKNNYKLLTRIHPPYSNTAEAFTDLCSSFRWSKVGILYDKRKKGDTVSCYFLMEAVYAAFRSHHEEGLWHRSFDENNTSSSDLVQILTEASEERRILVLCFSPDTIRKIMLTASELNLDNGDYVFINIDPTASKADLTKPWYRADDTVTNNKRARKAYEALMTLTLRQPASTQYKRFSKEFKDRVYESRGTATEVNSYVAEFYDGLILYALALNESLTHGEDITDGAKITQRMWNRTFEGIGGTVSVDENGDRRGDYSLLDLNPETGSFEVVLNLYSNKRSVEPVEGKVIHWAGGRTSAPSDTSNSGGKEGPHKPESQGEVRDPSPGQTCPTATEVALEVVKMLEDRKLVETSTSSKTGRDGCPSGWTRSKGCSRSLAEFTEVKYPERFCRSFGYVDGGNCNIVPGQTVSPNVCCT